jgi:hypothetical protein
MASWYFQKNGTQIGPISDSELRQAALSGSIKEETQIRTETSGWNNARSVKGLKFAEPEPTMEEVFYTPPPVPVPKAAKKTTKTKTPIEDPGFTRFATPVLVTFIWKLAIIIAVLVTGVATTIQFATGYPINGIIALVGMSIASSVVLLLIRVSLESVMVLFSIDASLKKLVSDE